MENTTPVVPCPCCGYLVYSCLDALDRYEICPICFWETDGVQQDDPDYEGGANGLSLNQARENFQEFGASNLRLKIFVRPPRSDEKRAGSR